MTKALANVASDKQLAELQSEFPTEPTFNRIFLPRLGLVSQDKTEGKGKKMKVVAEAGEFFIERQTEEVNPDTGYKIWERDEIGEEFEGVILYQRKQLRMYDENTEKYSSTPIYDNEDEVLPLFCDKKQIEKGTPQELKAIYEYEGDNGRMKSKLEDNRIVYVLYKGEMYQMNLRGSSMYSYMSYTRKTTPNTVVTTFNSEAKEKGSIEWNQMTFDAKRPLSSKEADEVIAKTVEIKEAIVAEKAHFANKNEEGQRDDETDKEYKARKDF
jgi:hypothetical protein